MKVINNSTNSHLDEIKELLANSNEVLIASPFLSKTAVGKLKSWLTPGFQLTLVTTLKEKDPDQLRKVPILMELFRLQSKLGFHLRVKIDNQLHGKVYIGQKEAKYTGSIVTSANFTEHGLEKNHEWGICVSDSNDISNIHHQILKDATIELTKKDVKEMQQWIDDNHIEDVEPSTVDVSFINMLKKHVLTYWLKLLGKSPNPVPSTILFGEERHQITFSKRKPTEIKKGDILLAYSVGSQKMISVFKATDEKGELTPFPSSDVERWPTISGARI